MPSDTLCWTLTSTLYLPSDVAASVDHAPGAEAPAGRWDEQRYRGSFRLKGQDRVYRIACEHGKWVVETGGNGRD